MPKISVVINTLNEEKNLPRAIESVKNFAGEVVICDMHSDDDTVRIAKNFGAVVYEHKRVGYVEPARNYAINKASGEWIFILDADEELKGSLVNELKIISNDPKADYYRIPRKNIIFGKWIKYSKWWPDYNIRFFRKGYVSWNEIIHSVPLTTGKGIDLEAKEENAIVHHHYESIEQYIERLNRYTSHQTKVLLKEGYKFRWQDLLEKSTQEFVGRFFQSEGYKKFGHGFAHRLLQGLSESVLYLTI